MSKFSQEASIQTDLPSLPVWPGDSRYATDSPTLTVHHQNLQVSCQFKKNFLVKQHQFPLLLELRSILTTNWLCLKCWKCIFSQSQDTNFQNFLGEHAPGPPTRCQKNFSHPCTLENFFSHNLQVLDSTRLAGLNIKDFSSSD